MNIIDSYISLNREILDKIKRNLSENKVINCKVKNYKCGSIRDISDDDFLLSIKKYFEKWEK